MPEPEALRRSFRIVCRAEQVPLVEDMLSSQGFVFEPEPFSPLARRLLAEPFPLGASMAATWGLIYIQDRSSMLPPLALAPEVGARVLDCCASPGSKTGLLAQLVGSAGMVLGNEPSRTRLATLRRNLAALNLFQAATCSWPGEGLPMQPDSWSRILLDPPCSGWGTTDKHPQTTKMWQGDKVRPLISLQRTLLRRAAELLAPGGRMVYSTCTTNVDENEAQVRFAVQELGLELVQLEPFPGFVFARPELPHCEGTLRVDEDASGAQGFFVSCLRKPGACGDAGAGMLARTEENTREDGTPEVRGVARAIAEGRPSREPENVFKPQPGRYPGRQAGNRGGKSCDSRAKGTGRGAAGLSGRQEVPRSLLEEAGLDPSLLPPGEMAVFNGTIHFLPAQALQVLPESLRWQGMVLGRAGARGPVFSSRLRGLINTESAAVPRLQLDDLTALEALLQGRSLESGLSGRVANLFWKDLPLGQVALKSGRIILA